MEGCSSNYLTCRACLQRISSKDRRKSVKLSDSVKNSTSITYLQAFEICSGCDVTPSEPQNICGKCKSDLLIAWEFKNMCAETQNELKLLEQEKLHEEIKYEEIEFKDIEVRDIEIEDIEVRDIEVRDIEIKTEVEVIASSEEPKTQFSCDLCGKVCKKRNQVLQHCNRKHEKNAVCPHCKKKTFLQFLDFHMKHCSKRTTKKSRKKSLCTVCGVLMPLYHITWHLEKQLTEQNPFVCDICGAKLYTKSGLINHMQTQHLKILIKCRYCNDEFRSRQLLDVHLRKLHPEIKGLVKCRLCDFTTLYVPNMRGHYKLHAKQKSFKCQICQREFNESTKLKNHMTTHSDARPFACDVCNATFKTKKTLDVHRKIHQEHDYECFLCQRTFSANQLLIKHMKKNHPEYRLPPSGTVMNKSYRIKLAEKKLKEEALRSGMDRKLVDEIVVTEAPPLEELQIFKGWTPLEEN